MTVPTNTSRKTTTTTTSSVSFVRKLLLLALVVAPQLRVVDASSALSIKSNSISCSGNGYFTLTDLSMSCEGGSYCTYGSHADITGDCKFRLLLLKKNLDSCPIHRRNKDFPSLMERIRLLLWDGGVPGFSLRLLTRLNSVLGETT